MGQACGTYEREKTNELKEPPRKLGLTWEDNIKINLEETGRV